LISASAQNVELGSHTMVIVVILFIFAILEFIVGIAVLAGAKSAIHEILGALAIGFSVMTLGLAGILAELRRSRGA
jgi:hypothetical protein